MPDYAFDLKLRAVVRLSARDPEHAIEIIQRVIECVTANVHVEDQETGTSLRITECSHDHGEDDPPHLFEVDGVDPPLPPDTPTPS